MLGAGGLLVLLAFTAWVVVVVGAFRDRPARGFAAMFALPYAIFFAFTRFEHPIRKTIVALWLVGSVAGGVLVVRARAAMAAADAAAPPAPIPGGPPLVVGGASLR